VARSLSSRSSREWRGPVEGDEVLLSVTENDAGVLGRNGPVGDHAIPRASSSQVARRRRGGGRVQLRRSCPSGLWAARSAVQVRGAGRPRSARGIAVADHHDAARGCASDAGRASGSESAALRGAVRCADS
jgi:hypothetical protein